MSKVSQHTGPSEKKGCTDPVSVALPNLFALHFSIKSVLWFIQHSTFTELIKPHNISVYLFSFLAIYIYENVYVNVNVVIPQVFF